MKTIDADQLIARVMRLSQGDLTSYWTTAGIIRVIEEEADKEESNCQFRDIDVRENP